MIQKEWNGAERLTLRIPESVIESYKLFGLGGFTKITLKDKRNKPTAFEFYQFICWHRDQFPRILSDLSSKVKVLEDDS
uniref:Uncharacterized protein n=1 Tax=Acrobeloides nanus TaxID=290746 RepID=A0A914BZ82_9BILA